MEEIKVYVNDKKLPVTRVGRKCYLTAEGYASGIGFEVLGEAVEVNADNVSVRVFVEEVPPPPPRIPEPPCEKCGEESTGDIVSIDFKPVLACAKCYVQTKSSVVVAAIIKAVNYMQIFGESVCMVDIGAEVDESALAVYNTEYSLELVKNKRTGQCSLIVRAKE